MWNALGGGDDAIICKVIATHVSAYGGLTNLFRIADVQKTKTPLCEKKT